MSSPVSSKKGTKSRWDHSSRNAFPPKSSNFYLITWLFELGTVNFVSEGARGIPWSEILAWSELSNRKLSYSEAKALHHLSDAYASTYELAKEQSYPAPYKIDDGEAKENVSNELKRILNSMIARQKKNG